MTIQTNDLIRLAPLCAPVLDALNAPTIVLSDEDKAHNEGVKSSVLAAVKEYTLGSVEAGIAPDVAGTILTNFLRMADQKPGTADAYGYMVQGFRKILETTGDITEATAKDAQAIMRSPEKVALDETRAELKPFVDGCNAQQLRDLLAYARDVMQVKPKVRKARTVKPEAVADERNVKVA